jgi:hypothetical protein
MSELPEWMRRTHYQEEDPGTVWTKDEGVVIDIDVGREPHRVLTPNVIALPEGGYRMYYYSGAPERRDEGVMGCIVSSFSADGTVWTKEAGLRVDTHAPDAGNRTLCPDVVALPKGGYRMYYQAHGATDRGVVLSSFSEDSLNWNREAGVRFGVEDAVCGSPRCVPLEDGRWRLYCHEYPNTPKGTGIHTGNHIISAIAADGLDFEREPGVRIEQQQRLEDYAVYAVEVLRLGDGSYRMYYAGWSNDPVEGRIFSATSDDGLSWVKDEGICLDVGGLHQGSKVSEPCVIRLPDGRFRMFYEANDGAQEWRILSATTSG